MMMTFITAERMIVQFILRVCTILYLICWLSRIIVNVFVLNCYIGYCLYRFEIIINAQYRSRAKRGWWTERFCNNICISVDVTAVALVIRFPADFIKNEINFMATTKKSMVCSISKHSRSAIMMWIVLKRPKYQILLDKSQISEPVAIHKGWNPKRFLPRDVGSHVPHP